MKEEKYDLGSESGMKFEKGKFGKWFENFWYHYKWHVIIALFLLIVIIICTVQLCSREEYDVHIIYAGSSDVMSRGEENDISTYDTLKKSISEAVRDFDGNGEVNTSLEALYMLSAAERAEIEKELADKKANGEGSYELNYVQLNENDRTFRDRLTFSDYYIYIISEPIYKTYQTSENGASVFVSLRDLVGEDSDIEFLDDCAIYLSSTEFGKLPGLCDLPENTLITLRTIEAISSHFNKEEAERHFNNSKEVIKNMLSYGEN